MSRLGTIAGNKMEDLLQAAPGAFEADVSMRQILIEQLTPRLFAMIGVAVAACLRCERFADNLRGPLDRDFSAQLARDWRAQPLTAAEKAALAYAEKGTLDEASVRKRDVDDLRAAGFSDRDVLLIATSIAYHNYSIRMAAAFGVTPS
jgi:alkylhydroperoxidase family enzyme